MAPYLPPASSQAPALISPHHRVLVNDDARHAEETMTVAPMCTYLPATRKSEFNITAPLRDCIPTWFRFPRLLGDFPVGGNKSDS